MTPTTASAPPTCEARTGYTPGEFAELPLWCNSRVGLSTWTDQRGMTHRACRHHRTAMQRLYPVQTSEACRFCGDTAAIVDGRYVLVAFGNGALGVVCDACLDQADDEPDDPEDEYDGNPEGDPTLNGAFA